MTGATSGCTVSVDARAFLEGFSRICHNDYSVRTERKMLIRRCSLACVILAFAAFSPPSLAADKELESATLADMNAIVTAMGLARLDTTYYTSIENLNDFIASSPPRNAFDDIDDRGGTRVIDPRTGRWTPDRKDLVGAFFSWKGPYLSVQSSRISIDGDGYDPGTLLDFWDTPYYFFTPLGLARPDEGTITLDLYGDRFHQYAIVSLGPDRKKSGDDIVVFFGSPPSVLSASSVTPATASKSTRVTIRGYKFGSTQGSSRVVINDREIDTIESWSDREIVFNTTHRTPSGPLQVDVNGRRTGPTLRFDLLLSADPVWPMYQ